MFIAINSLKLFLIIMLALVYLFGQGWIIISIIFQGNENLKKEPTYLFQQIPLAILIGLIINYGISLIVHVLIVSLIAGSILAAIGIFIFLQGVARHKLKLNLDSINIYKLIGALIICLIYLVPILVKPLEDWDARSIWFFHSKMIYEAGTLDLSAYWQHSSIQFSHTDYPKLIPLLAAQVTFLVGYWNEYLPKLSLSLVLVPAIFLIFREAKKSISFLFLILLLPVLINRNIWNGLMDGYLALYFSISMLFIGRYYLSEQKIDLITSFSCLIFLPYLKNEGYLALLTGCIAIIYILILKKDLVFKSLYSKIVFRYFIIAIIFILPLIFWEVNKNLWGLTNDLGIGTAESIAKIIERLSNGSLQIILVNVFFQIEIPVFIFIILHFSSLVLKIPKTRQSTPSLIAATAYCSGIIIIYLLTPNDLYWHLETSIARTILSINSCLYVASYFILDSLEIQYKNVKKGYSKFIHS